MTAKYGRDCYFMHMWLSLYSVCVCVSGMNIKIGAHACSIWFSANTMCALRRWMEWNEYLVDFVADIFATLVAPIKRSVALCLHLDCTVERVRACKIFCLLHLFGVQIEFMDLVWCLAIISVCIRGTREHVICLCSNILFQLFSRTNAAVPFLLFFSLRGTGLCTLSLAPRIYLFECMCHWF